VNGGGILAGRSGLFAGEPAPTGALTAGFCVRHVIARKAVWLKACAVDVDALLAVKLFCGGLRPIVSGRQGACLGFCGVA